MRLMLEIIFAGLAIVLSVKVIAAFDHTLNEAADTIRFSQSGGVPG